MGQCDLTPDSDKGILCQMLRCLKRDSKLEFMQKHFVIFKTNDVKRFVLLFRILAILMCFNKSKNDQNGVVIIEINFATWEVEVCIDFLNGK